MPINDYRNGDSTGASRDPLDSSRSVVSRFRDLIPRRRSKHGDRLPSRYAGATATVDTAPLSATPLMALVERLEGSLPTVAVWLHHFYDHRLLEAGNRLVLLRLEVDEKARRNREEARQQNAAIGDAISAVLAARDAALAADQGRLLELDGVLAEANARAAVLVSQTGGSFDPKLPDESCVLRHSPAPLNVLAGAEGLPLSEDGGCSHAPAWLPWFLTVVVGTLVGISVGLLIHALHGDSLARHVPEVTAFAVLGFGLSTALRYALKYLWGFVGQYSYLPRLTRRCCLCVASIALILFTLADVQVETRGLFMLMQSENAISALSGPSGVATTASTWALWLVGLIVSAGYLVLSAAEGYARGRHLSVAPLLAAKQHEAFAATDSERRSDHRVQSALAAISHVHEVIRQQDAIIARIVATAAPFDGRAQELAGKRRVEDVEPSETDRLRVQDAVDDFVHAQETFDGMLAAALKVEVRDRRRGGGSHARIPR